MALSIVMCVRFVVARACNGVRCGSACDLPPRYLFDKVVWRVDKLKDAMTEGNKECRKVLGTHLTVL